MECASIRTNTCDPGKVLKILDAIELKDDLANIDITGELVDA